MSYRFDGGMEGGKERRREKIDGGTLVEERMEWKKGGKAVLWMLFY